MRGANVTGLTTDPFRHIREQDAVQPQGGGFADVTRGRRAQAWQEHYSQGSSFAATDAPRGHGLERQGYGQGRL